MLAYQVTADGYGYKTDNNKFFWSNVSAGKFCETQLYSNLIASIAKYVEYNTNAMALGPTYNTIRRDAGFNILTNYVRTSHPESLIQLALEIIDLEPHLRAIIPGKSHTYHLNSKAMFNDIIWLCIRIRKQFKKQT